ncbi:hypothetical protein ACS0TY_013942 [Phlomoides rotata]
MELSICANKIEGPLVQEPHDRGQNGLTMKDMQQNQYSFLVSDVSGMFDDLLNTKLIELPQMKHTKETKQIDNLKYS